MHIFNDGFSASLLLLLPFIAKELHLSLTQVGLLGGMVGVCAIFLALPAGSIGSRFGGVQTLLYALGVYSLGFLLTGLVPSFYLLIITFLLASIGLGIFHPIAFGLVAKWTTKENRGKEMGNFTAIGDIGRVGLSAGITFFITMIGWRLTSFGYAIVAIAVFCFLYFFYRNRQEMVAIEQKTRTKADLKLLFKNKQLMLASFAGAIDTFASSSLFVFLPFLLLTKHIQPVFLGSMTAAFFIGNFIGKAGLGRIVDRFGNTKVFIIADILMAVFILILTTINSIPLIIVVSIILGALTKGTVPVAATLVAESVEDNHEHAFSVSSFIDNTASALSPLVLGFISDMYGVSQAFTVAAGIALVAVIPVIFFALAKKTIPTI